MRREAQGAEVEPCGDRGLCVQFELLRGLSEAEAFLEERDGDHGRDFPPDRLQIISSAGAPVNGLAQGRKGARAHVSERNHGMSHPESPCDVEYPRTSQLFCIHDRRTHNEKSSSCDQAGDCSRYRYRKEMPS